MLTILLCLWVFIFILLADRGRCSSGGASSSSSSSLSSSPPARMGDIYETVVKGPPPVSRNSFDDKFHIAEILTAGGLGSSSSRSSEGGGGVDGFMTYFIRAQHHNVLDVDVDAITADATANTNNDPRIIETDKMKLEDKDAAAGVKLNNLRRLTAVDPSDSRINSFGSFIDNKKLVATPPAAVATITSPSATAPVPLPEAASPSKASTEPLASAPATRNAVLERLQQLMKGEDSTSSSSTSSSNSNTVTPPPPPPPISATASSSKKLLREVVPNMKHQSQGEKQYLALHKCRDSGEAYGAAYLITKQHIFDQDTGYNLTWVNCEMGSFIMMNGRANPQRDDINGTIIQTLDVLDFSVIHLSAYERLIRRWHRSLPKSVDQSSIEPITKSAEYLKSLALQDLKKTQSERPEYSRTVVIMPFLGSDMGAGHSKLNNRLQYLRACFWSFYRYFPHIVAYVKSEKDLEFAKNSAGLPFFDVVINRDLPKSASLPVSTVQRTKAFIMNGTWDFDFVLFTESDQILMLRNPEYLYDHLAKYPRRIIIPHRLMPYPESILTYHHKRPIHLINYNSNPPVATSYQSGGKNLTEIHVSSSENRMPIPSTDTEGAWIANSPGGGPLDWTNFNCCLARQNCMDRKGWLRVATPHVPVINAFGLQVPLGNTNFHEESYRTCALNTLGDWSTCP